MIRSFARDVSLRMSSFLQSGRCTVIAPDAAHKDQLQRVFISAADGAQRGVLPDVLTVSEWAQKLHKRTRLNPCRLFLTWLQELRSWSPQSSWSVLLRQAQLLLRTARFCHQEGGTAWLPPLPLAHLRAHEAIMWHLLQDLDMGSPRSDEEEEASIELFLREHPQDAFIFFDAFPAQERPFLQALRCVFPKHGNAYVWQPSDPPARTSPFFVGEFASEREEAAFLIRDIQHRLPHGSAETMAVVSDDETLRRNLCAEGMRQGLLFRTKGARVSWASTPVGSCALGLACWLTGGSAESWERFWGDFVRLPHIPEEQRRFWHFFLANIAHAPGLPVGETFIVPKFASESELKTFVSKKGETVPEMRDAFLKLLDWRKEKAWNQKHALSMWLKQHCAVWADLGELVGISLPRLGVLHDVLSEFDDKGELLSAREYVLILESLLRIAAKEAPLVEFSDGQSRSSPWLLSVKESALMALDTVYLAGVNESWVCTEETPPFFYNVGGAQQKRFELVFHQHLARRVVTVTRTASPRTNPHPFWYSLSEISPAYRVEVAKPTEAAVKERHEEEKKAVQVCAKVAPSLRPRNFSVTDWQLLQDDPYAFYAKTLLKVYPLPKKDCLPRDLGLWAHHLLYRYFSQKGPHVTLEAFAEQENLQASSWLTKMFWPRLRMIFREMSASWEEAFPLLLAVQSETRKSRKIIVGGQPFSFFGVCDRVDFLAGKVRVVDFKTGSPPKEKEIREGRAWQLPLEASMLQGECPDLPVELSVVSLRSLWGRERELTLLFDETLREDTESRLKERLEAYMAEDFTFETLETDQHRTSRYAALERLPAVK